MGSSRVLKLLTEILSLVFDRIRRSDSRRLRPQPAGVSSTVTTATQSRHCERLRKEQVPQSRGPSFRYRQRIQSPVPGLLFDLFHGGSVSIAGRELRLDRPAVPVPVVESDHIRWVFPEPVKVSTPGPDSSLSEIRQYRDKICFEIWPWASVVIEVIE